MIANAVPYLVKLPGPELARGVPVDQLAYAMVRLETAVARLLLCPDRESIAWVNAWADLAGRLRAKCVMH